MLNIKCETSPTMVLSEERASVLLEHEGPSDLTPVQRTPEIVCLAKNMFDGFSMLLWIGAFICFFTHLLELYTLDDPQYDKIYIVEIHCDNRIPADIRIIRVHCLKVDNSSLAG
ncbi:unnamed protein product [Rotaria sp. Silwood2]|nr:unnamed protein product [Rotaria sp. Silwood2]